MPSAPPCPIRLAIVDDHTVLRQGLRALLEEQCGCEVVAEAADGVAALEVIPPLCPDVVIMDINMPRMNGIEATRRLVERCPGVLVIALTMNDPEHFGPVMRAAGAVAVLSKEAAAEDLCEAIRRARESAGR